MFKILNTTTNQLVSDNELNQYYLKPDGSLVKIVIEDNKIKEQQAPKNYGLLRVVVGG